MDIDLYVLYIWADGDQPTVSAHYTMDTLRSELWHYVDVHWDGEEWGDLNDFAEENGGEEATIDYYFETMADCVGKEIHTVRLRDVPKTGDAFDVDELDINIIGQLLHDIRCSKKITSTFAEAFDKSPSEIQHRVKRMLTELSK